MKTRQFDHYGFWAKAAVLVLAGLWLVLLPDWGIGLRAQTTIPPHAANDVASTAEGTPVTINVLANDTGTELSIAQVSSPASGSASTSGGAITYTPNAGFVGADSFTYTIRDGFGQLATATVTVAVIPPALNAANDTATTTAGSPVSINVLANDTGTGLSIAQVISPAHGSATISGGAIIYTPSTGFVRH